MAVTAEMARTMAIGKLMTTTLKMALAIAILLMMTMVIAMAMTMAMVLAMKLRVSGQKRTLLPVDFFLVLKSHKKTSENVYKVIASMPP